MEEDRERGPAGEFELIEQIRNRLESTRARGPAEVLAGIGEDAAITVPPGPTATSVDLLVEDVHFRLDSATMRDVGHKALAAALSDLAAMGAVAGEAYVALALPGRLLAEAMDLCEGLADVAERCEVALVGGDVSASERLVVAVTVVGHAECGRPFVTRAGAHPGSVVAVTGSLGAAGAGQRLLDSGADPGQGNPREAVDRQLRPWPRLAAGRALAAVGAEAMIDVSDGLVADAGHIAAASGVAIELDADRIPLAGCLAELAPGLGADPLDMALAGGEDYELLAVLPAASAAGAIEALSLPGPGVSVIGEVKSGAGVTVSGVSDPSRIPRGYEHLRRR